MATTSKFFLNEENVNAVKLGNSDVKIYLGQILVYEKNDND